MKRNEPVALGVGSLAVLIDALLILCTTMDWLALTTEQTAALVTFVTVLSATVGFWLRETVWSPDSVAKLAAAEPPI